MAEHIRVLVKCRLTTAPEIAVQAAPRSAGWTERYYLVTNSLDAAKLILETNAVPAGGFGLLQLRAKCMANNASITGYTLQRVDDRVPFGEIATGPPVPVPKIIRGTNSGGGDVPQMGLGVEWRLNGQPQTVRKVLRGIPDYVIQRGEYYVTASFDPDVRTFLRAVTDVCGVYVDNRAGAAGVGAGVLTIGVDGNVVATGPVVGLAVNGMAKVTQTTNSDGRRTGGIYRASAVAGAAITLAGWDRGATTGGRIRAWSRAFAELRTDTGVVTLQRLRKIGSPKDYRGRNHRSSVIF